MDNKKNTGNCNSGNCNSGNRNSGDFNSGDLNSGYFNSGDHNSGWFNTNEPKMRMFNKDTDMTYAEFFKKYNFIYPHLKICRWVTKEEMTEKEKKETSSWEEMGGYLKTLTFKEAWAEWWGKAKQEQKDFFLGLPNFSWEIFTSITGIEPEEKNNEIIINGVKYRKCDN